MYHLILVLYISLFDDYFQLTSIFFIEDFFDSKGMLLFK